MDLRQLTDSLVRCGIVDSDAIQEHAAQHEAAGRAGDLQGFTAALTADGLLTDYQAQRVLRGEITSLVLGKYVLLDKVGEGGMGQVYKARHRYMDRIVALKTLPPGLAGTKEALARFQREILAVARLKHPNIVTAFDADEADGVPFLAMEYVEGQDLASVLRQRGPLPVEDVVDYVLQAAKGLQYAHARGVLHRDVKPANLLLDTHGTVKVLDLGLAKLHSVLHEASSREALTATGKVVGTIDYMSPEQAEDMRRADARSDVYSLACTLWTLLTGRPVYGGDSVLERLVAHREASIPSLCDSRSDVSQSLNRVFQRMVAKLPDDRLQSMEEVITALTHCTDLGRDAARPVAEPGTTVTVPSALQPATARRRGTRRMLWAVGILVAMLAAGAVVMIATDRGILEINTPDDVQVVVWQNGQEVAAIDTKAGRTVRLRSGQYDVSLAEGQEDHRLNPEHVAVRRGKIITVEVERASPLQPATAMPSQPAGNDAADLVVGMNGLSGLDSLHPSGFPSQWRASAALAHVTQAGRIEYPLVPVNNYVLETELTIRSPKTGRIVYELGETGHSTALSLGYLWPRDRDASTAVPCRLFRYQPWGANWLGEERFPAAERLQLKVVVAEQKRALFYRNRPVLQVWALPADLHLRIVAEGSPDAAIHSCQLREIRAGDVAEIGWAMPNQKLDLSPEVALARVEKQRAGLGDRPEQGKHFVVNSIGCPMRWIPAGEFEMGADVPHPALGQGKHRVRLRAGYWIGQYELTQEQWLKLLPSNPSRIQGSPYLPVNWISWEEAVRFCATLNDAERRAGHVPEGYQYRLPSEAEWEYACRAGTMGSFAVEPGKFWGPDSSDGTPRLHEVGELPANDWGLYDMHGNAAEWCLDVWEPYPEDSARMDVDPVRLGKAGSDWFAVRSGCWASDDRQHLRSTSRDKALSIAGGYRGLRIALGKTLIQDSTP